MSNFNSFDLDEKIVKVLQEIDYVTPTPIQEQAIPKVMEGTDIIACAQTGTGKTAAFMLPIIDYLIDVPHSKNIAPKVLILVPTRELAMQVSQQAKIYTKHLPNIKTVCIYGGVSYAIQNRMLSRPYDILVATPGRLIDHLDRERIDLSEVSKFILDEADRMLDMGFIEDIEKISSLIPKNRQTLLFSATIDNKILPFSKKLQKDPFHIKVERTLQTSNLIAQKLYYVDDIHHKNKLLEHILQTAEAMNQTIVFTSTIKQADELSYSLKESGYLSGSLHGDMSQEKRTRTINKLKHGKINILVATDVAARGIDISTLTHVINFDLPFQSEDFIHRIGRTGRAGATGTAITFATYKEDHRINRINQLLGKPLESFTVEGLEPKPKMEGSSSSGKRKRGSRSNARRNKEMRRDESSSFHSNRSQKNDFSFREERRSKPSFERNSNSEFKRSSKPDFKKSEFDRFPKSDFKKAKPDFDRFSKSENRKSSKGEFEEFGKKEFKKSAKSDFKKFSKPDFRSESKSKQFNSSSKKFSSSSSPKASKSFENFKIPSLTKKPRRNKPSFLGKI
ncbi:MAG: hypothetical protein BGO10_00635 [Chlamydia sp. 32-24]|nr:MAG: hypothetical protein BGO10_00635 [Chlamydia sp. 32-24]